MSLTQKEAAEIKTDVAVLKNSMKEMSDAHKDSAIAQTKVANQISELLIEMRETDVRNEYLIKQVDSNTDSLNKFIEFSSPILHRTKSLQDSVDDIKKGLNSNTGKLISALIFVFILYIFGIDVTKFKI